jgi:hypothetical protein
MVIAMTKPVNLIFFIVCAGGREEWPRKVNQGQARSYQQQEIHHQGKYGTYTDFQGWEQLLNLKIYTSLLFLYSNTCVW